MTPDFEEKQSGFSGVLMWCFAGAALFMFLGLHALWGPESRWAETAREMLAAKDFLHPAVNWQVSWDQPLFAYWQMLPFMQFMGAEELAVRFPSALMALAGLAGTFTLAKKIFDRNTALLSSWLLLSAYGFLFWGRTVSAEMAGMAFSVLAVSWFFNSEDKSGWIRFPVFYLLLCLGISAKGFQLAVIPILFLLPHLVTEKRWRSCIHAAHPPALIAGLLIFTAPFYLASLFPPERLLTAAGTELLSVRDFFLPERLSRIFAICRNSTAFHSCLCNLPRLLLPWTLFFILGVAAAVVSRKTLDRRYREFLIGILLLVVYFTVNPAQRWYHILPLVPFCCIFTAAMLYSGEREREFLWLIHFMRWLVILAASLAFAAPIMLPVFQMMFKQLPPLMIVLALPLAGLTTLIVCIMDNEPGNKIEYLCGIPHLLVSTVVGGAILSATVFGVIRPGMTVYRTGKTFIKELVPLLAGVPKQNIIFYETDSVAEFQFYLRWDGPVTVLKRGEIKGFLQRFPGEKIAVFCYGTPAVLDSLIPELKSSGAAASSLTPVRQEPGKGKKWVLFLFELPSASESVKAEGILVTNKNQQITGNIK